MSNASRIDYVNDLEVVGFADFIEATQVPSRVAPIFGFRTDPSACLFPPFRLVDEMVIGGTVGKMMAFKEMVESKEVTELPKPLPAERSGMLWVDERLELHYGTQDAENKRLSKEAESKLLSGFQSYRSGDLQTALLSARWASAANQRSLKALVLEAAVYKRRKNPAAVALMEKLSTDVPDAYSFKEELEKLVLDCVPIPRAQLVVICDCLDAASSETSRVSNLIAKKANIEPSSFKANEPLHDEADSQKETIGKVGVL